MNLRSKEAATSRLKSRGGPFVLSWITIAQVLVIAAVVLWIYWPALHGGWLWDDDRDITDNTITQSPTGLWSIWFVPGIQIDYYPIKASVQWLQWHLWGMDTLGYHLTNVLLHTVSALLVWRLLSKFHLRLAWLGGLIFAVHPVQVESVAWIAELKNTLSLPPCLLAMCSWIDFEERGRAKDFVLGLVFFLVAMLCKLSVVLFPLVLLLYIWWRRGRIGWNDLKISLPFFGVALLVGMVILFSGIYDVRFNHAGSGVMPVGGFLARLAAAGLSLAFCFSKSCLPIGLLPIYPKWPVDPTSPIDYLPLVVLGGVIYWLWTKRWGWGRHALLGLGFFLINLAPCPGFIPAPDMAFAWVMDHFLYLPIIGLIGLVVAALGQIENQLPASFRPYAIGLMTAMTALSAFESRGYAALYVNSETFWTYELRHNPEAYPAHDNLGRALSQEGRLSEAIAEYDSALQINPSAPEVHINLGAALLGTGRVAEAIEQFKQALRLDPDFAEAHNNLGSALQQNGRLQEATDQFKQALRLKPDFVLAYNNLGGALQQTGQLSEAIQQYEQALQINPNDAETHYYLGSALQQTGQLPEAMDQFKRALQIKPDYAEAHNNLGGILFQTGQLAEAREQFELALQIKPSDAEAHYNLGDVLAQTGEFGEAMEQYNQALQIRPDYPKAHNNLGMALLQAGQGAQAMEQFEQALRFKPDFAEAHYNLGNSLFQAGRVSEAIEQYEQALQAKPDYAEVHNNLGAAFLQTGRFPEAEAQFKEALRIRPDYADAQNNLTRVQALQKTAPATQ